MEIEIRPIPGGRVEDLLAPISVAFGNAFGEAVYNRVRPLRELEVRLGAYDGDALVGAAGAYSFQMTIPGGVGLDTAGLTVVAVVPTHRRRGVLTAMIKRHFEEARGRGQVMSALFASEGAIYGRFGYGLASIGADVNLSRHHTAFFGPRPPASRPRFVSEDEAVTLMSGIWDRVRLSTPGMLSRSPAWWISRRLGDPEALRGGKGPLQRVVMEIDGRPAAYAIYRFANGIAHRDAGTPLEIAEALGDSPGATRAIWRWLFDIDIVSSFQVMQLAPDHPLFFMLLEPRRLQMTLRDALWTRLLDVPAALSRRSYGAPGPIVIEVEDALCPWNTGRYRIQEGAAARTEDPADLALGVAELSAAYLGGVSFTQLAAAGRVAERTEGALVRADAMFRSPRTPWCPETF